MMRSAWLGAGLLVVCTSARAPAQTPQPQRTTDADEIVRLTHEWGEAVARRDATALDRLLAEDFTFVSPRGRLLGKERYIQNRLAGSLVLEPVELDQVTVRVYGDAAILTSRYTARGEGVDNVTGLLRDIGGDYTRTDTWVRIDGLWRVAANHLSPVGYTGAREATESAALHVVSDDRLEWVDSPVFPGARTADLFGAPYSGPYVIRRRRPDGHAEEPHYHESDEYLSVLKGVVHLGVGGRMGRAGTRTIREGGLVVIPSRTLHYSWAEGDVLEMVHWSGPAAAVYRRPAQDR